MCNGYITTDGLIKMFLSGAFDLTSDKIIGYGVRLQMNNQYAHNNTNSANKSNVNSSVKFGESINHQFELYSETA